jgi:uncharacterized damage-inducible protein DinB
MSRRLFLPSLSLCLSLVAASAFAEEPAATKLTWRSQRVRTIGYFGKQLTRLLEAFPQDKLSWRPAEGTKSGAELFMHIATAAGFHVGMLSGQKPDFKSAMEKMKLTDKAAITEAVQKALESIVEATKSLDASGRAEVVKAPWGPVTKGGVLDMMLMHMVEHKAQLAIYARMNGIVPPWVPEQEKMFKKMMKKMMKAKEEAK